MNKTNLVKTILAALAAGLLATQLAGIRAHGADAPAGTAAAPAGPAAKKPTTHAYPFRGTIDAIDPAARTLQLDGKKGDRILHVTGETVLERDGKPVKFEEIARGDYAKGLVNRPDGTREVLVKATFGPKPDKKARRRDNAANR